jgi:uncharacterized membrane protein
MLLVSDPTRLRSNAAGFFFSRHGSSYRGDRPGAVSHSAKKLFRRSALLREFGGAVISPLGLPLLRIRFKLYDAKWPRRIGKALDRSRLQLKELLMIRLTLWILGALLLGGIVHLSTVLAMPTAATQDAYSRLVQLTPVNAVMPLTAPSAKDSTMPFMDPAFAVAVCRYDLSSGALKLRAPLSQAYTSVTFYTRNSVAYYAINDRAAGRRAIELDLMTEEQHAQVPEEEDVTAADRLIIESPTVRGLIVLRALAPEPSLMAMARRALAGAQCRIEAAPTQ